jgi:D-3-phosphoglycerate dehydrogenase
MTQSFRVGVTRDFLNPDGTLGYGDIGLGLLDRAAAVDWEFLPEDVTELRSDQIQAYDALLVLAPRVTAATVNAAGRLAIIARFGVGYDSVDVDACTRNGILVTITPDGVRRPLAVAAMTFILSLGHKLLIKDHLTRTGRWTDKLNHMGIGMTGRTLGVVGLGNIGRELATLAAPFGLRLLGFDPYVDAEYAATAGVQLVDLDTLLRSSDFVCITCALTPETYHLVDERRLALMKPTAYLINIARGPIVDEQALIATLQARSIQGAGLDVFEQEPIDPSNPLLSLDNVVVTPHAIGWTDECFFGMGRSACESILDVAAGRVPRHIVNRAALDHPAWRRRLAHVDTATTSSNP